MDRGLVVVDIGNSSIKVALFAAEAPGGLPRPLRVTRLASHATDFSVLDDWLPKADLEWLIGSVKAEPCGQLTRWLATMGARHSFRTVTYVDLPLRNELGKPEAVGIDRLAAAVAANALREWDHAAIVVDAGSAITIDVISARGAFLGGSIAPGLQLRLHAMHHGTDKLPLLALPADAPLMIGKDTESAMLAGAFWSVTTGIEGMISRIADELDSAVDVFLTGGSTELLLPHLRTEHRYEPYLVLSGLATAKR